MSHGSFTLVVPSRPEYLLLVRLALTGVARLEEPDAEVLADLQLAVTEAVANACRHAYPGAVGDVRVELTLDADGRLEVVVEDDGAGFDPEAAEQWNPDELGERGMGLSIIRAVAHEVEIGARADGAGTRLRFTRALRREPKSE